MKMETSSSACLWNDPAGVTLAAGDLEDIFLPSYGMLGASLCHFALPDEALSFSVAGAGRAAFRIRIEVF